MTTKTTSPTHDEIAQRAQEIWSLRGHPSGHDLAIWLEAEQQLSSAADDSSSPAEPTPRGEATTTTATPDPDAVAAQAELQKQSARAPRLPVKNAPHSTPPISGKPLWDKPHSS